MDILRKNDFIVKHSGIKYFDTDLELFNKYCPNSDLHRLLKRVNTYNKDNLHRQLLFQLLDKASPEIIFNNRKLVIAPSASPQAPPEEPEEPQAPPEEPQEPQAPQAPTSVPQTKKKQSTKNSPE